MKPRLNVSSRIARPLACLALLALPFAAVSADDTPLEKERFDRITLAASAQAQVENNLMRVVFTSQSEQKNASAAADSVNKTMQKVEAMIKDDDKIRRQYLDYNTQPVYNKQTIVAWRVQQSLMLESESVAHLADRMGQIQSLADVQSVSFDVTDAERKVKEDELIRAALDNFNARAKLIAQQLGASSYRIVQINVDTQGQTYYPQRGAMKAYSVMADEVAAPVMEAGKQTLTVNANGEIALVR